MSRSLTFAFLDSWHDEPESGSGTTVAIRGLGRGLEALGHRVVRCAPGGGRWRGSSLFRRLAYNLYAALDPPAEADLVVGFDLDGFLLPRTPDRPPVVVALKGVAADEALHERGAARIRMRTLAALERASAHRAEGVVVSSAYSARRVVEEYGIPASRIAIVPEGIDLEAWEANGSPDRRIRPDRPGRPVILSVARQYPRKNTADLLEALPRLAEAVPDVLLRVVGDGPCLGSLRRRARRLGLEARVEFTGALPRERVRQAYLAADCFCLPSLQEGFGLVFLEAMAAGLPVVAARAGAVPEVVRDGREGVLVAPGEPAALADALRAVLTDPARARRMAAAGRARAREYDWTSAAQAFLRAVAPLVEPERPESVGRDSGTRSWTGEEDDLPSLEVAGSSCGDAEGPSA